MKNRVFGRDVLLILASSFFYMASPMLVTPLVTGFSESLGANAALMGVIGGLMNICSLFCRPVVGNLADRISKYKLSFIGSGLLAVACIGYMIAADPLIVAAARVINGIGFSCCSVCMSTWMSNLLPKEKIGSGMGIYGTMNALAMAVSPSIGVTLFQTVGYKAAFTAAAIFAILTMIMIQFVHDKGEPSLCLEQRAAANRGNLGNLLDKKVIPVAITIMLFGIPFCATQSFLVRYVATRELNVTVSLFFPLYAVVLLILRLVLKELFDKKSFSFFLILSSASALVGMFCLTVMNNNLVMFAGAAFMAGGYGIMCSVCQSTAILMAGEGKRGLANSTYYVGVDLGMALGPILGGVLYGSLPLEMFYPVLAITVPICVVVNLLANRK